jgi:hypothetical protein
MCSLPRSTFKFSTMHPCFMPCVSGTLPRLNPRHHRTVCCLANSDESLASKEQTAGTTPKRRSSRRPAASDPPAAPKLSPPDLDRDSDVYYIAPSSAPTTSSKKLSSAPTLALRNFRAELTSLVRYVSRTGTPSAFVPPDCLGLTLDNAAIAVREAARETARGDRGRASVNPAVYALYRAVCWYVDVAFNGRPIQRAWFLETVARMPYFA